REDFLGWLRVAKDERLPRGVRTLDRLLDVHEQLLPSERVRAHDDDSSSTPLRTDGFGAQAEDSVRYQDRYIPMKPRAQPGTTPRRDVIAGPLGYSVEIGRASCREL